MNFGEANLSSPKVDTTARTTSSSPKYYIASRVDYLASYQFPPTQVFPKSILVFPVQNCFHNLASAYRRPNRARHKSDRHNTVTFASCKPAGSKRNLASPTARFAAQLRLSAVVIPTGEKK